MEDNTGSRESKKKSMEDNTRSSESKEKRRKTRSSESKEKRRKSMEDNTRSSESKEKKRKSMEDNTPTKNLSYPPVDEYEVLPKMARRAGSSSPHVEPGQNIVLVRPKPLGNPTAPMEADEKIIEEKAVCKVCFAILREEENILKTKCKCSNALIHETCVADGNKCGNCRQKVQTFPVTLVRGLSNSTPVKKKKAKNVLGRFHG